VNATKARLVDVSAGLFQRRGLAATGIKEILAEAQAPFSSLYHHFPGGKDELAEAAIRSSGMQYQALVEEVWDGQDGVVSSIAAVFDGASQTLEATDFVEACPIAVIALEVASTNEQLRTATAQVFEAWIVAAGERLISAGIATDDARRLALSIVCLIEGAFVLSQAMKSTEPMRSARDTALQAIRDLITTSA
jgi:AcrR family transcriptional regulator